MGLAEFGGERLLLCSGDFQGKVAVFRVADFSRGQFAGGLASNSSALENGFAEDVLQVRPKGHPHQNRRGQALRVQPVPRRLTPASTRTRGANLRIDGSSPIFRFDLRKLFESGDGAEVSHELKSRSKFFSWQENSFQVFPDKTRVAGVGYTGFFGDYVVIIEDLVDKKAPLVKFAKHGMINVLLPLRNFTSFLVGFRKGRLRQFSRDEASGKWLEERSFRGLEVGPLFSGSLWNDFALVGGNQGFFKVLDLRSRAGWGKVFPSAVKDIYSLQVCRLSEAQVMLVVTGEYPDFSTSESDFLDMSEILVRGDPDPQGKEAPPLFSRPPPRSQRTSAFGEKSHQRFQRFLTQVEARERSPEGGEGAAERLSGELEKATRQREELKQKLKESAELIEKQRSRYCQKLRICFAETHKKRVFAVDLGWKGRRQREDSGAEERESAKRKRKTRQMEQKVENFRRKNRALRTKNRDLGGLLRGAQAKEREMQRRVEELEKKVRSLQGALPGSRQAPEERGQPGCGQW